jgi:hypothetical protein
MITLISSEYLFMALVFTTFSFGSLSDGFTCEKTVIKLALRTKNNNVFFKN